jgi:hypothetical protein
MILDDALPTADAVGLALGEHDHAGVVLDGVEEHLNGVTGLRRVDAVEAFLGPLLQRDDAFGLVADVHDDVVADDAEDAPLDDLVHLEVLRLIGQPAIDIAADVFLEEGVFEGGLHFFVGEIELAEQIAVDHD